MANANNNPIVIAQQEDTAISNVIQFQFPDMEWVGTPAKGDSMMIAQGGLFTNKGVKININNSPKLLRLETSRVCVATSANEEKFYSICNNKMDWENDPMRTPGRITVVAYRNRFKDAKWVARIEEMRAALQAAHGTSGHYMTFAIQFAGKFDCEERTFEGRDGLTRNVRFGEYVINAITSYGIIECRNWTKAFDPLNPGQDYLDWINEGKKNSVNEGAALGKEMLKKELDKTSFNGMPGLSI